VKFDRRRRQMISDIEAGVAVTRNLIGKDRLDKRVMTAMRQVHREDFVPPDMRDAAFRDGALPIGHGQTISQPYIVALMTDLLELSEQSIVLEIGTGTGYQAAILACLAKQVYSIERIPALAQAAQQRLQKMGYDNVETRCGDGYQGWPEKAPLRRRLPGLARKGALRRHRGYRRGAICAAGITRATQARRAYGHPCRHTLYAPGIDAGDQGFVG